MPRSPQASRKDLTPDDTAATAKPAKSPAKPKAATKAKPPAAETAKPVAKSRAKTGAREATRSPRAHIIENPIAQTAEAAGGELALKLYEWLDEAKAEDIVVLDIRGKTSIGDCMLVASGRSDRHVGAIADQLQRHLKQFGVSNARVEGVETCDWVLVDVGAIIVHLFRPEVREFYNLEKMWSGERPGEATP
jgi:ribosome-associated protein